MLQKNVLLIEDDPLMVGVLAQNIERAGFRVESTSNAEEALKKLPLQKPDIILLDILLPGLNGFDFLQMIKNDKKFSAIPVIILSNFGSRTDIDKGMVMGATAYLIKSNVLPEDVISKIKEVLVLDASGTSNDEKRV